MPQAQDSRLFFALLDDAQAKSNRIEQLEIELQQAKAANFHLSNLAKDLFFQSEVCPGNNPMRLLQKWASSLPPGMRWDRTITQFLNSIMDRKEYAA